MQLPGVEELAPFAINRVPGKGDQKQEVDDLCAKFILDTIEAVHKYKRVLIYCKQGANRSPAATVAVIATMTGESLTQVWLQPFRVHKFKSFVFSGSLGLGCGQPGRDSDRYLGPVFADIGGAKIKVEVWGVCFRTRGVRRMLPGTQPHLRERRTTLALVVSSENGQAETARTLQVQRQGTSSTRSR